MKRVKRRPAPARRPRTSGSRRRWRRRAGWRRAGPGRRAGGRGPRLAGRRRLVETEHHNARLHIVDHRRAPEERRPLETDGSDGGQRVRLVLVAAELQRADERVGEVHDIALVGTGAAQAIALRLTALELARTVGQPRPGAAADPKPDSRVHLVAGPRR